MLSASFAQHVTPISSATPNRMDEDEEFSLDGPPAELSPIHALFAVQFHPRHGPIIIYKRCVDETVSMTGIEFKALPSKLHNVDHDLVFVNEI